MSGVGPDRCPFESAPVAESPDTPPGVPGVGPKTAAKWITLYGDLPGIIAHAEEIKGKAGQSLRDHLDEVERNRRMNAAVLDLDLPADPEQFELRRGDAVALNAVFDELAFGPTIRRDVPAALLAGDRSEERRVGEGSSA